MAPKFKVKVVQFPKIIIYGLNFKPEKVGVGKFNGELADYLHKKGHDLRIITAPKYYPEWIATKNEYSIEDNFTYKVFSSFGQINIVSKLIDSFKEFT